MKQQLLLGCALCALLAASPTLTWAEDQPPPSQTQVQVDLKDLNPTEQAAVLAAIKAHEGSPITNITPQAAHAWAGIGKEIGSAFGETAKALNISVNDFIKTPAGVLTVWTIFLYLFGHTLWSIIGGSIAWIALTWLVWHSSTYFLRPRFIKTTTREGGKVTTTVNKYEYEWSSKDSKMMCAAIHTAVFVAVTIMGISIVF